MENAISVSAEKVMAPIPIPKFNPGFGSRYRYRISVGHYEISYKYLVKIFKYLIIFSISLMDPISSLELQTRGLNVLIYRFEST